MTNHIIPVTQQRAVGKIHWRHDMTRGSLLGQDASGQEFYLPLLRRTAPERRVTHTHQKRILNMTISELAFKLTMLGLATLSAGYIIAIIIAMGATMRGR